jgi:NAD(P)H dehydrogenase (quinone)
VQALQDMHIFRTAGLELLEHLHFDEVTPDISETTAGQYISRVRSCA